MDFLIEWTKNWAYTPHSLLALFGISFIEASFFPVPPDVLLITMGLLAPKKALIFSAIATVGSTLGGCFGYLIGIKGGYPILRRLAKKQTIDKVHKYFQRYEAWAILTAAFTPIPYKIFSISAGVFYVNFKIFVLASLIGRGGRFFLVGLVLMLTADALREFIFKYFEIFTILFIILLILGFISLRFITKVKFLTNKNGLS
jgi:membrane protein YqaA with SNARE-associated domain